jgi:hypothetical protein
LIDLQFKPGAYTVPGIKEKIMAKGTLKAGLSGKTKKIFLFYDGDKYKDPLFVGINGMTWLVKRGEEVEVPVEVAEVIENQLAQDKNTAQMIRQISAEAESALAAIK